MEKSYERVVETLYDSDDTVVFRRSDGTIIGKEFNNLPSLISTSYVLSNGPPPLQNEIRTDSTDVADITKIWIARIDGRNYDLKFFYMQMKSGNQLFIQDSVSADDHAIFTLLEDPIDDGDYITLNVKCDSFNGTIFEEGIEVLFGVFV
jgi:hypothetical protein